MTKYRENMSEAELAAFNEELQKLEEVYQEAAQQAFNAELAEEQEEDQMEYWRRAGLDHRGQP